MQQPNCRQCTKLLKRFKYADQAWATVNGVKREWGHLGNNKFCTMTCGFNWALAHVPN